MIRKLANLALQIKILDGTNIKIRGQALLRNLRDLAEVCSLLDGNVYIQQ